ncbi:MAG: 6-phospho-beta-glucosidase [Oscillospiraceae bacterium]|nr:6-phospho-beta-glucosidase [Oscillospiraceae bacterium]
MAALKAAVIGAGSSYTPELIEGFIDRRGGLPFGAFYLMDIDAQKLGIVGDLAKRMLAAKGFDGEVVLTQDCDEALAGADYVFAQIRVGQMQARIKDEKIPLKYGLLGQETTGAGGFMNALRTVPVMLDIARRMEKLAPNAWLVNFSNPSGIVAQAILDHTNVKMIGLCNAPINMLAEIGKQLGGMDFDYDYTGLNHLGWITSVRKDGKELLSEIDGSPGILQNIPQISYDPKIMKAVPYMPNSYLSYYYRREQQIEKCLKAEKTRGEVCVELEASLMEQYKDPNLSKKPEELSKRGGAMYSTAAVSAVDAIHNGKGEYHIVNTKNNGAIPFLDDSDVVEVKCLLGKDKVTPVPIKPVENDYVKGLIQAVKAYERLAVKAAMAGCRETALAALMIHPLVGDFDKANAALDEMLEANRPYTDYFFG